LFEPRTNCEVSIPILFEHMTAKARRRFHSPPV
jgi:hypothetical protein